MSKQASKTVEPTGIIALDETEYLSKASEAMRPDGEQLVMIDVRRLETIEDLQSACKNVHGIAQAAVETAGRRAIVANTSIGRGLIWGYTAVCDYAGTKQEDRTKIENLTAGKVAAVLGINNDNCERLYGVSWGHLNACIELGRADDHDQREAELLLADEGKSVTVKSLREACNAVLHPELRSNRKDGARKSAAAAKAALAGGDTATILATGVKAPEAAKLANMVAASLLAPTALQAATLDQLKATKWAVERMIALKEAEPKVVAAPVAPVEAAAPVVEAAAPVVEESDDPLDDLRRDLLNAHQALLDGIADDAARPALIDAVAAAQAALDAARAPKPAPRKRAPRKPKAAIAGPFDGATVITGGLTA